MANSYDTCLCGHAYPDHDPGSLICRFQSTVIVRSCGCQGFSIPGATLGAAPDATPAAPVDVPLSGDDDN
jgi:hypothetical protein